VRGALPGESSGDSSPGSRRCLERQSRACYVLCGSKTRTRMGVGQADARRALEGTRGFLETGVDALIITGQGRRLPSWTAFLYTLTSLIGGGCQLPLGARRARENRWPRRPVGPPWTCSPAVYGCGKRRRPAERGLFGGGFLVPRVVIAMGSSMGGKSLDAPRARRRPTPDSLRCARDARKQRGTPDASFVGAPSARASPARLWRISLGVDRRRGRLGRAPEPAPATTKLLPMRRMAGVIT
jgi:hypothetical protein